MHLQGEIERREKWIGEGRTFFFIYILQKKVVGLFSFSFVFFFFFNNFFLARFSTPQIRDKKSCQMN